MTFNLQDLSDEELIALSNRFKQPQEEQFDIKNLSDEDLMALAGQFGIAQQSGRQPRRLSGDEVGVMGSVGVGAIEGITDLPAIAETVGTAIAPEKPEGMILPRDVEAELVSSKPIEEMSFAELFSLTDDDILPPAFIGPTAKQKEEVKPPIQEFREGLPESDSELARIARQGARFGAGAATLGAGVPGAVSAAGSGVLGQTAREAGTGEIPAIILELGGLGAAKNLLTGKFKKPKFNRAMQEDIQQTAKNLGLKRLPTAVQTESRAINFVENLAQQSVYGKKAYEGLFNEIQEGLGANLEKALSNVSRRKFTSLAEGGENLQQAFTKAHNEAKAFSRGFYGFAENAAKDIKVPVSDLIRGLDRLDKKLGQSFVPEGKEAGVRSIVRQFKDELKKAASKDGTVPLDRLVAQRRSIRSMINYEDIGGAKQFLKGLDKSLTKTFERVGKQNPEWFARFSEADKNFANQAKWFRNKLMKNVLFNESPEGIMNALNKPSDIAKLENALNTKGISSQTRGQLKGIIDAVKRRKVEDILLDRVTGNDGKITLSQRSAIPKNKKEMINALLPKESRALIKDIDRIRNDVAGAAQKFANNSRTFANAQDVAFITTGLTGLLTGNIPLMAKSTILPTGYWVMSKVFTSETMPKLLEQAGKFARAKNATKFNQVAAKISAEFERILNEEGLDRDQVIKNQDI